MNIDDEILINQMAQGIVPLHEGQEWFQAMSPEFKKRTLQRLNLMILNATPRSEDAVAAISLSGLKPTLTPCVLLAKPNLGVSLAKIANLAEEELVKGFILLIAMLGIVDRRRRMTKPLDVENHWWHRNLGDPAVVAEIRRLFGSGSRKEPSGIPVPMKTINRQMILESLKELSDRSLQERLWTSTGAGGTEVSSFTEARESLFSDSGLSEALEAGQTGLGGDPDSVLRKLHDQLMQVNSSGRPVMSVISDSAMERVRALAGEALKLLIHSKK